MVSSPLQATQTCITTTSTLSRKSRFLRATPSGCASLTLTVNPELTSSLSVMEMAPSFGHGQAGLKVLRGISNSSATLTLLSVEFHFGTDGSITDRGWRLEWGEHNVVLIISMLINVFDRNGGRRGEQPKEWGFDKSELSTTISKQSGLNPDHPGCRRQDHQGDFHGLHD